MDTIDTVKFWAENPYFDPETQAAAKSLLTAENKNKREECFGRFLEFGTGGLRGIMDVGTNRINRYTIKMATEGVARIIKRKVNESTAEGVVIGYDSRHHSFEFAQVASEVLAAHGIPVYLFHDIAPTPLVSCELLRRKAIAGIIITASHNPPEYNGYKVYWENGGLIVPPEDTQIINEVRNIERIDLIKSIPFEHAVRDGIVEWIAKEADEYFIKTVRKLSLGKRNNNKHLGVIFTPLHGTGGRLVPELLRQQGFNQVKTVAEQMVPDGNFSTVVSPNPEDIKAFEMAVAQASEDDDLILANDPDADRLGVMVRDAEQQWHWLTGNQIGVLLLDFILSSLKQDQRLPNNGVIITTVVTSPLIAKMARDSGLEVIEVLTGFKWIRKAALQFEREQGAKFVFGMEESHGYLMGNHSGDKDGIWASMAFAEMVATHKANGLTPIERLEQIHQKFGIHIDSLKTQSFPGSAGLAKMQQIMQELRNAPPQSVAGQTVIRITDFLNNTIMWPTKNETTSGKGLPQSNVISLELSDHSRITARPSGTEPKIKFYFNLHGNDLEKLNEHLTAVQSYFSSTK
ncbi:MAG: phospho-sugar mutase [SAR324 cluster bacterium]|nr:phospho-sugar mutase [SAR324 cluster bacterium]MBL7034503.1 phospho-sugar mutase [SAR324 cluster bacterium]